MNNNIKQANGNRYNSNYKETWEIGKDIYWQGIHSYDSVYKAIRYLGFYLWVGDESRGIPSYANKDEDRAKIILEQITKWLYWSKEKVKSLWEQILACCRWRKGKKDNRTLTGLNKDLDQVDLDRSNSISNCKNSYSIYAMPDAHSQEKKYPSKEEIQDIFKKVLGDKIDFSEPLGFNKTMLRALRL